MGREKKGKEVDTRGREERGGPFFGAWQDMRKWLDDTRVEEA